MFFRRKPRSRTGKVRFLTDREKRSLRCQWPRHVQQRALAVARMLTPFRVVGVNKIRIGGAGDGGYVMLDDFEGVETAFSLGIGPNVDWDFAIAERGIVVHQFDGTVDGPPRAHDRFRFHKRMIASSQTDDNETLVTVLDHAITHRPCSSVLKMDVENDEWAIFADASQDVFEKFSRIVCEFHALELLYKDWHYHLAVKGLQNLKQQFEVTHVHANNSAGITFIDGAPLPFVIEVTLANWSRYDTRPSEEWFPTALDVSNNETRPDYDLGRFVI